MKSVIQKITITFIFSITILMSCSPRYNAYTGEQAIKSNAAIPQYNNISYWAAHPQKTDPSDSVPAPLRGESRDSLADVFFIHPTTFTKSNTPGVTNASVYDNSINAKTDYSSILYQASVFNASAKVYAPRYRQAFLGMFFENDRNKTEKAFDTAYEDVKNAFLYYLRNNNKGRPIIIASHSQGTIHAKRLLNEFFEGKPLIKQLVCAYLLGMPVEKTYFRNIPVCKDSTSTGCYVSWRTYRKNYTSKLISPFDTTINVVNPLSWNQTKQTVVRKHHKGAVLYNYNKVYKQIQDATIAGSVLWITKPRFPGGFLYFRKNYHAGDINLFYLNIREDVKRRTNIFIHGQP